jgi:hypothetical protein
LIFFCFQALSRSHEHVFAVTPVGMIRCFKFATGVKVMDAIICTRDIKTNGAGSTGGQGGSSAGKFYWHTKADFSPIVVVRHDGYNCFYVSDRQFMN